ncbi:MAG TPA: hypothetical protein VLB76_09165 [Thermoanaerobaculia bacterium]|nr:hypothetical protein [Thermoanaerobaculia bacterium]
MAEFEAARVRQAADRASSQKRGIVIAGISLKLGLALLCLGILAISTDSCESTLRSVGFALDKSTGAPNLVVVSFYKALLDWPYWVKIVVVILGTVGLSLGLSQLIWALREVQESLKRHEGRSGQELSRASRGIMENAEEKKLYSGIAT